jgi:hypothetical protein
MDRAHRRRGEGVHASLSAVSSLPEWGSRMERFGIERLTIGGLWQIAPRVCFLRRAGA